jgi:hypothetical protein
MVEERYGLHGTGPGLSTLPFFTSRRNRQACLVENQSDHVGVCLSVVVSKSQVDSLTRGFLTSTNLCVRCACIIHQMRLRTLNLCLISTSRPRLAYLRTTLSLSSSTFLLCYFHKHSLARHYNGRSQHLWRAATFQRHRLQQTGLAG